MLLRRVDPLGLVQAERRIGGRARCRYVRAGTRSPCCPPAGSAISRVRAREVSKGTASFHQLREYVPGDDMRHIHWRTSARTGTLVVKQLVDTTRPEVVVVVDNRRAAVSPDDFEEVVEIAASILQAAENDGFPALLIFADGTNEPGSDGVPIPFIDRLTAVTLSDVDSLLEVAEAIHARGRSLVFVTGELRSADITLVNRLAHGFSPAYPGVGRRCPASAVHRSAGHDRDRNRVGRRVPRSLELGEVIEQFVSPALGWARRLLAPAVLVALTGAMFGRAFDRVDLVIAIVVSIVLGGCVGWLASMRQHLMRGAASVVVPVAALCVAGVAGVSAGGRSVVRPRLRCERGQDLPARRPAGSGPRIAVDRGFRRPVPHDGGHDVGIGPQAHARNHRPADPGGRRHRTARRARWAPHGGSRSPSPPCAAPC